ncbi:MAG: ATP synthase subunit I [Oscillospiraceae bacterium]|nr:ATP synthase subunit I [Oscillospiraceae bacterium]
MESRKTVFTETGIVATGQLICVAVMVGIFALLGYFDYTVVLGGIAGALVAVLNFLFMAIGVSLAADKAGNQDVKGGKALISGSYFIRILVMFAVLFACAKSGHFNPIALVLPLVFVRPTLTIAEFFRKKGV